MTRDEFKEKFDQTVDTIEYLENQTDSLMLPKKVRQSYVEALAKAKQITLELVLQAAYKDDAHETFSSTECSIVYVKLDQIIESLKKMLASLKEVRDAEINALKELE